MGKLITPFGEIDIIIDGQSVSYTAREGKKIKELCSKFRFSILSLLVNIKRGLQ